MEITRTMEVYTLDELGEEARKRAVSRMVDEEERRLADDPWGVSEAANGRFWELATGEEWGDESNQRLQERFGVRVYWGSYPWEASVEGTITREACPALAWPEGVEVLTVEVGRGYYSSMRITSAYGKDEHGFVEREIEDYEPLDAMLEGICDQLAAAVRQRYNDICSEEYAVMVYDDGVRGPQRRFLADGSEAPEEFWTDDASPQVRAV